MYEAFKSRRPFVALSVTAITIYSSLAGCVGATQMTVPATCRLEQTTNCIRLLILLRIECCIVWHILKCTVNFRALCFHFYIVDWVVNKYTIHYFMSSESSWWYQQVIYMSLKHGFLKRFGEMSMGFQIFFLLYFFAKFLW